MVFVILHAAYYSNVATIFELNCGSEYSAAVDLLPFNGHLRQCNEEGEVEDKSDVNEGIVPVPKTHTGLILFRWPIMTRVL